MSDRLRGKAALITGSTSNIGKAIAIRFAAEGACVVVTGRDAERGSAVVGAIQAAGGQATLLPHELDGSVEASKELAELATKVYGSIDILVNNAGIYPPGGTLTTDGDTFDRIMAVNVKAPYFLTAALVPAMAENGRGVVLNLGSWGARLGTPAGTAYASTKGAMETLTRAWAAEFGPRGVRVNAISPGVTFDGANPVAKIAEPMMGTTPLGRLVAPDAIARRRRVPGQRRRRRCPRHRLGRRWRAVIRAFRGSMTKLTAKDAATRQHTSSAAGVSREVGLGEAMHDGTDRSPKVRAAYPAGLCA